MKMYDITVPIYEGMPVYKNKPEKQPKLEQVTNAHVTESRLSIDVHTGTHIDAPLHMINEGETFETLDLEKLVGACKVLDLSEVDGGITQDHLQRFDIEANDFILFKTKNSYDEEFNFEFVYLAECSAKLLAEKKIRGVGIDALGVERSQEGHPTHKTLFGSGIIVIEGLQLKEVKEGPYFMVAAPLKLIGTDAAPARVLLFEGLNV
ncbi:cyclase family protein [Anaerobacillus isosaccharinicus]|uniref:Kynurenine formamidase n=1 Tax=Anaerobacillus isosaccharinicus TaxID=1532552 RepID=A0A1S2M8Y3_9BACI|nr:cyclase family protein [Anaerobacillus isosaccharinicus]MBA5587222.1 cyclase family protein [Anaerobacillus isosaccharinicus]QOY34584.1 cyclase family protein [Anaerobacillus isosaccharinicus]